MESVYTIQMKYKILNLSLLLTITLIISGCSLLTNNNAPGNTPGVSNNSPTNTPVTPTNNPVVPAGNKLDLSNKGLTSIPGYVFNMTNLQELNVSHNRITGAIQAEIRHLQNLKILNASYNQMTGVPAEIGQLSQLEVLDLSYNQLTGLPYELGNLIKLKTFNLKGNNYATQDLDKIKQGIPNTNIIVN